MKFFETHAHYDFRQFDADRDELLSKTLPEFGISHLINIGTDINSSRTNIRLAKKYPYIYAAVGFHPHDTKSMTDDDLLELKELAGDEKVIAIGEIGLDFHYDHSPRDIQKKRFLQQLELAREVRLPVMIHSRESDAEVFKILKDSGIGPELGGIIHCYSGSIELAMKYIDMGFHIGIGGIVTYNNARELQEAVRQLPIERLVLETDCPFLSPAPKRGGRNDSTNLLHIAEKIAQLRNTTTEKIAELTNINAQKLFL